MFERIRAIIIHIHAYIYSLYIFYTLIPEVNLYFIFTNFCNDHCTLGQNDPILEFERFYIKDKSSNEKILVVNDNLEYLVFYPHTPESLKMFIFE